MILTCPACTTAYNVPDAAIGAAGRQVRCAACKTSWFQAPPGEETPDAAASIPAAVQPAPPPPPPPQAVRTPEVAARPVVDAVRQGFNLFTHAPFGGRRNPARMHTMLAAGAAFTMLAAVGALAFIGPPDIRAHLGLEGNSPSPIELQWEKPVPRTMPAGNVMLDVSGQIVNPTQATQTVPPIRASLHNAEGRTVFSWIITPPVRTLPPGGRATFDSAAVDIPRGETELRLTLDDDGAR